MASLNGCYPPEGNYNDVLQPASVKPYIVDILEMYLDGQLPAADPQVQRVLNNAHVVYYNYIQKKSKQLTFQEHFDNICKLTTRPKVYEKLILMFLDQEHNLLQMTNLNSSEKLRVEFAQFCFRPNVMAVFTSSMFTLLAYQTMVLCFLFRSLRHTTFINNIATNIKTNYFDKALSDKKEENTKMKVAITSICDNLANFSLIVENRLYINQDYLHQVQVLYFKRIMNDLTYVSIETCIALLQVVMKCLEKTLPTNDIAFLSSLMDGKIHLFMMEWDVVKLCLMLCLEMSKHAWKELLYQAQPLVRQTFARYIVFVYSRLTHKQGPNKRLIIKKDTIDIDLVVPIIQEYLQAWFRQENYVLSNNIRMLLEVLQEEKDALWNQETHTVQFDPFVLYLQMYLPNKHKTDLTVMEDAHLLFDYKTFVNDQSSPDSARIRRWIASSTGGHDLSIDDTNKVESLIDSLILQYNRCIHPPLSWQALQALKFHEKNVCKNTHVAEPIFKQEEINHLPIKIQNILQNKYNNKPVYDNSLQLSRYFCDSCNQAYKAVCGGGGSNDQSIYDYEDEAEQRKQESELRPSVNKLQFAPLQELYKEACTDMRMLYGTSCKGEDDEKHAQQFQNKYNE
jgi:hypothetical protein